MANRFNAWFLNYRGRRWNIYLDDADFVGTATEFKTGADGFTIDHQGDNEGRLTPIMGSSASFGMALAINEANHADLLTLITDLAGAEEGRFTVKITRGTPALDEVLHWCGFVLPDISRLEDKATVQEFRVSATDGLARLKGIEYKDDSGANDVPWGNDTVLTHLLRCLTADSVLSNLYFATDDIFLRTVVEWEETGHDTLASNQCPTAYTRFSGYVFAELKNAADWQFKNCYEALSEIAKHWNARLYFSDGCYRFEQLGARSAATFTERRWKKGGTLSSSASGLANDETTDQTLSAGFRLSGGEYAWLAALKRVKITYDHQTYKNYLAGTNYKWYKTSGNSDPLVISNVAFDADSYIRVSGVLTLKVTGPTAYPWRQVFAMYLDVGDYSLKRHSAAVQPFYLIEYDTPAEWLISSVRADISTDFIFSGEFEGQIPFSIWTPVVPSGVNSISVDFDVYGAFDAQENNETTTIADWAFKDLVLTIYNLDTASNFEAKRIYQANNTDTGNSAVVEQTHLFGHAVKKWTQGKLQVTSDLVTWNDATATWKIAGGATNYEFGQLAAEEILSGQNEPLKTYSGQFQAAEAFAHYRIITNADSLQWLLMRGSFTGQWENLSGQWWNCGINRTKTATGTTVLLPHDVPLAPDVPPGSSGNLSPGTNMPTANGTNIALNALTNNFTNSALTAGAVTTIPVAYPLKEDAYELNDEIILVNPQSGKLAQLTVTTNSNSGDTSLAVSGTLPEDFPLGSYLIYSSLNKTTNQGGISSPANYWTKTGSVIQNNNIGQVRIGNTFRIGVVTGTPTTLIGRDGSGDVGTVAVGTGLSLSAGTLSATGSGTVTSVGLVMPTGVFDVAGSPVTGSGDITVTFDNQTANTVFAGPGTGLPAAPAFRALVAADIPAVSSSAITGLTDNQVLFGSATGGVEQSANLTYDGTIFAVTGKQTVGFTNSYSTSQNFVNVSGTVTSTAAISHRGINSQITYTNDGIVNNSSLYGVVSEITYSSPIKATGNNAAIFGSATNTSANASTLYGTYGRISEQENTTSLTNRMAGRYEALFTGTGDLHTVFGFRGDINATSTGRWLTGYGGYARVINAKTAYGFETHITNNRGTANTQRGLNILNEVSGSGVVVDNAYGIDLRATASSSGVITNYYGIYHNSVPSGATQIYFLYGSQSTAKSYFAGNVGVGSGSSTPAQTLHIAGTARITGSDGTATTLMGRDGDGDVSAITVGSGLSLAANTLTATAGTNYQTLRDDGSAMTQRPNANFVSNTDIAFTLTDDAGNTETEIAAAIETNAVTDAKFRQSAGLSVVGRSANTTGNVADIAAASDFQVLRRSGTSIGFGSVNLASANAVTGTLPVGNGGTGQTTLANDAVLTGNGTSGIVAESTLTFNSSGQLTIGTGTAAGFLNIFSGALGVATEMIRCSGNISSNMILSLLNANNATTNANTIMQIATGGSSAGDPTIQFSVTGVVTHAMGIDNSDSDSLKITPGQSLPGGVADRGLIITNAATSLVGVNKDAPAHPLDVSGRARANQWVQVNANPTHTFGAGAGTGPTLGGLIGGANGFKITFTTGTTPTNNALIFTITLPTAFPSVHTFVHSPGNVAACNEFAKFYTSGFSASQISVTANGTLTASTQYILYYVGIGY